MRSPRTLVAAIAAAILSITLAACGSAENGSSGTASSASDSIAGKRIAYLTVSQSCEYCARQANAFTSAMKMAGAEVTMSVTNFDAAEQAQQLNQAVSTKPDIIVIWPTDNTSIIPALERIKQTTKIPVVVTTYLPRTDDTSLWAAWVGPNDKQLGVQAAQALIAGLKETGNGDSGSVIMVTGTPGGGSTIDRGAGFEETLKKEAPGLKIVGSQPGNWDQTQATTAAANLISQFGKDKIVGVFAQADNMLAGAIVAAERAGYKAGTDLVAVGSDCTIEGYTNIEAGKQYGTNLQNPVVDGSTVAEITTSVLKGQKVENITYIDTPAITKANLAECASAVGK
ncbi:sugar ABC transporter substrate-binding protein [Oryzobacter terrae]|uniref:sugar ABC transporter substrate-binding protein n=1 Tax=Oryzobacter terrae TaxID=1620385 RepID=UPI00366E44A9